MNYKVVSNLGTLYEGGSLEEARQSVISCLEVEACFGYDYWETERRQCWDKGNYLQEAWWSLPEKNQYRPHMSLDWCCICHQDISKFVEIQEVLGEQ